ncbi:hypothetical protein [Micromonospora psammae]|uniref:hypothetical protein n=1 Tax=Micromonospora sp. CPCC 205556 TaxID=3122398 RepID=UPI002FEEAE2D
MTHQPHRQRPSDRATAPDDVTDRLLWALAVDVAAAHPLGPDGSCRNLQCHGQRGPCRALHAAHRAQQLARQTPNTLAATPLVPGCGPEAPMPRSCGTIRGRASVPPPTRRFTGWFTPTTSATWDATTRPETLDHRPFPQAVVLTAA